MKELKKILNETLLLTIEDYERVVRHKNISKVRREFDINKKLQLNPPAGFTVDSP
jgi:hypothetical protein